MKRLFLVFLFLVSLAFLVSFSLSNLQTVSLNLWPNQPLPLLGYKATVRIDENSNEIQVTEARKIPVFLLIFLSLGLGFILSSVFSVIRHLKERKEISKLRRIIKKKEDEINSLRILPIKEETHEE